MMDLALRRRLTTVVAGPGYGKTTLLASWAWRTPCAWYTLTGRDRTVPVLASGLLEALRVRLPGLLDPMAWYDAEPAAGTGLNAVVTAVADGLERARGSDVVLVIEDVGELGPGTGSMGLLEALCRQMPPGLHLVLSSRVRLPFPVERLRGRGQVLELDGSMLAFDVSETRAVLAGALGDSEPGDTELGTLSARMHEITRGWPAATRLAAEWLRHREPGERLDALAMLHRPGGPLFGYLTDEVLPSGDPTVQLLLPVVAPLPRFSVELCRALGVEVGAVELAELARGGVFVTQQPGQPGWFTLGPLVRDLAAAEMTSDHRQHVLRSALAWFTDNGHLTDAVRCALALDEPARTAGFLADHGQALLAHGAVAELLAASSGLPMALRSEPLERLEGQAQLVRGNWPAAMTCLRRAAGDQAEPTPALAWRLCSAHYARGELDEALGVFDRTRLGTETTADEAFVLSCAASAARRRGLAGRGRSLAERAMAAAMAAADDHALAAAHTALLLLDSVDGDRAGTDAHAVAGLAAARRADDVLRMITLLVHRAADRIEQGSYAEALGELDLALSRAEQVGDVSGLAEGRHHRGTAHLGRGQLDEAIADFEAAGLAWQRMESRDVAFPLLGLGDVYRERGDLALARSAYTEAVRRGEASGDGGVLASALAGLARVLVGEDPRRAGALAERAVQLGQGSGRLRALLAAGWVALDRGAVDQADARAGAAVESAGSRRDRAGLAEALELRAAVNLDAPAQLSRMREAARIWAEVGNPIAGARNAVAQARMAGACEVEMNAAEQRLRALGVRDHAAPVAGLLSAVPAPACPEIQVRTLGEFVLLRRGRAVRAAEWSSRKARTLLKLLISRRGRPTPREVLIETLWPGEDPRCCTNRLSIALSTLRTVLDPERRHPPDHFVHADRYVVGLANLRIDVEEFLAAAARVADRPLGRLLLDELRAAEARFTGDFLEGDLYEDWTVSLREQAEVAYLSVTRALAHAAGEAGDEDLAVRLHLRVLERDPYDEQAHLGLTAVLVAAGRNGQARDRYLSYTQRMIELGIEPAPFPAPPAAARRAAPGR